MFMVVIHELGHYTAGKILGFKINEFGIGFGPAIFKKKNKKTGELFTIRPIPLGGFCQFEGEDEDENTIEDEGAFNKKEPWKRLIVLFSGAFCNFISAIILIALVFTFYGQILPSVYYVAEESTLYQENLLQEGDTILCINGQIINIVMEDDLDKFIEKLDSDEVTLTILRDGKQQKVTITKSTIYERDDDNNIIFDENNVASTTQAFGFSISVSSVKLNFFTAVGRSFSYGFYVVYKILWLLGQLILGKLSFAESAGGPVTVIKTMADAGRSGFGTLLYMVCLISANLAVMNLLPLPALDGSRMVFTIIEWIRHKPINRKVEGIIHTVGFLILFLIAIAADVFQFLS
jgi:regulator of sigma E protease